LRSISGRPADPTRFLGTTARPVPLPDGSAAERPRPKPHLRGKQDQHRNQPRGCEVKWNGAQ